MARVLVVEDEATVRILLEDLLGAWGHEVEVAAAGDEAIEKLAADPFDLVVLDLMLGAVSGYDVLDAMNRQGIRPATRVIILTARSTEWDYLLGWMRGADQYLTKPFDPVVLQRVLDDMLVSSPEELEAQRKSELEKAQMLFKLESSFGLEGEVGGGQT